SLQSNARVHTSPPPTGKRFPDLETKHNARLIPPPGLQPPALNRNPARLAGDHQRDRAVHLVRRLPALLADADPVRIRTPPRVLQMPNQGRALRAVRRNGESLVDDRGRRRLRRPGEVLSPAPHVERHAVPW